MCPFPEHQRFRVIRMSRDQVIDIMTYNSYSLQYYSFGKEKTMRLDLTNHTSTKTRPKKIKTNDKF